MQNMQQYMNFRLNPQQGTGQINNLGGGNNINFNNLGGYNNQQK